MLQGYLEQSFTNPDPATFKNQALAWASQQATCTYLTDCGISYPEGGFIEVLFAGIGKQINEKSKDVFADLETFHQGNPTWLAGYFSYDVKNQIEDLSSNLPHTLDFPEFLFYQPLVIVFFGNGAVRILSRSMVSPLEVYEQIVANTLKKAPDETVGISLEAAFTKQEYMDTVRKVQNHILNGDIYQMNLCIELKAQQVSIDPLHVFLQLIKISPAPFAVFQKSGDHFAIGSSPERFLKKTGRRLLSQPMKGTAARHPELAKDIESKKALLNSEKERAENLMITDLVRNDLSKSSNPGTTKVEELFGVYSFSHVHQMITSVSSIMSANSSFTDVIKNAFPMGSMTGAPKIKAMQLIEQYEKSRRGLFSGAIGYVTPEGDFDFNVVIRTLLYNRANSTLSLHVGSAITYDSDPEKEYEECMLKSQALLLALQ